MDYAQTLIYGIVLGSIIGLGAFGLSLSYSILRFANFAHGDILTAGAYVTLLAYSTIGLPLWLAFPVGMAGGALVAIAADRLFYVRLRRTKPVILLISSFGVALIIRALVQLVWGPDIAVYDTGIQPPLHLMGLRFKPTQFAIVGGAIVIVVALHLFLSRTRMGRAMRAMSDNADLARVSGIDTERVILWTWGIAGALTGAAGAFLALDTQLHPTMGWKLLLSIFAAAILGGIGRPYGAIMGGLVIGLAQEYSVFVVSPAYKPAVAFAIMVLVLIARPSGLFGGVKT